MFSQPFYNFLQESVCSTCRLLVVTCFGNYEMGHVKTVGIRRITIQQHVLGFQEETVQKYTPQEEQCGY